MQPSDPAPERIPAFLAGLAFTGSGLDRAVPLRADPETRARLAQDAGTRFVAFWRGRALLDPGTVDPVTGAGLYPLRPGAPLLRHMVSDPIFLGLSEGQAVFAADLSGWAPEGEGPDPQAFADPRLWHPPGVPDSASFTELRGALTALDARAGELVAIARALMQWHETHGFCGRCGAPSRVTLGGWQRWCPACDSHHFPRTDPVVIMRIIRGNHILMGRSPGWPEGMYSCLAGFIEPGETVEDAVRREVFEESRVRVGAVRYLTSQPWPFPTQLMIACEGEALDDTITIDPVEIEDALWISRERLADVLAGTDPVIHAPRSGAVAGWMMRQWLADRRA
ncbi:NAD(+) diphosphatase [Paenirhodobacter populi]|uniref:NAD(+) diphosphatase n=1 Tax=Paenirhodobacter populi TaxID=2306993 RepID=A0A443JNR0_9RHOB|nr:NAD(+) diphosphatase [Sinirhodobacter populi]RWR22161.1 NAD(+) diphosphatase [Sinirhodobacter populi]